ARMTEKKEMPEKNEMTRRSFIEKAAVSGAAFTILPRHVLGRGFTPPSDMLNIACVGVGGMGRSNLINLASQNIVALCDVDWGYTDKNLSRLDTDASNLKGHIDHPGDTGAAMSQAEAEKAKGRLEAILHLKNDLIPKAKRYSDYRKMLEQQKDIDAIVVATPDHMHTPIALAAMDLNKHVYVQKPLCWSVGEAREGNQAGHADGQPGPLVGCGAHCSGACLGRYDWRSSRSPCVDGSPRRLLAARRAAPEGSHEGSARCAAVEQGGSGRPARGGDGQLSHSGHAIVGFIPRCGADRAVSPDLSPVQLARLGGLGLRRDWRHGRASARRDHVEPEAGPANQHRDSVLAFQWRFLPD